MHSLKGHKSFLTFLVAAIALTAWGIFAVTAHANPFFYPLTAQTSTATTSVSWMTPGTATSTVTYDAYNTGVPKGSDYSTLFVQFNGSSTSAVLGINLEYSQDGIDWYRDNLMFDNGISTTTPSVNISTPNSYTWTYSATNVGGAAGTKATSTKAVTVKTPTRFVRAVISITGANGAVWAQIVPARQSN